MTKRRRSDYEQGRPGNATAGPNDSVMAEKTGWWGSLLNGVTETVANPFGFDVSRRTGCEDNDFYRDNAQYMPGYDIDGMPSGAWAQDRATNHVGHSGSSPAWDNIRRGLVRNESARIDADLAAGGDGRLGFGDVYDAHVEEYADSGGGGNQFIDPGSFALAMYGAPALEALGIDSGAVTGASIDFFNNPDDSPLEGWAKRMGLGLAEVGLGAATGNPLLMGLGLGGMLWNTATAIGGEDTANFLSDATTGISNFAGDVLETGGNLVGGAVSLLTSW